MTTGRFRASVQYNDWKGTAAADNADGNGYFSNRLVKEGLLDEESEILVGIEFWVGENADGKVARPSIHAFCIEAADRDSAIAVMQQDPIQVRCIDLDMSLEEFFACFKRFSIVLNRDDELRDREFQHDD